MPPLFVEKDGYFNDAVEANFIVLGDRIIGWFTDGLCFNCEHAVWSDHDMVDVSDLSVWVDWMERTRS